MFENEKDKLNEEAEEIKEETVEEESVEEESGEEESVEEESVEEESAEEETAEEETAEEETAEEESVEEESVEEETAEEESVEEESDEEESAEEETVEEESAEEETVEEESAEEESVEEETVEEESAEEETVEEESAEEETAEEETAEEESVEEESAEEESVEEFELAEDDGEPIAEIHFEEDEDESVDDFLAGAMAALADTDEVADELVDLDELAEGSDTDDDEADEQDDEYEPLTKEEIIEKLKAEGDYLDYDEDEDKPKHTGKTVSGKTAVVTMLLTAVAMIVITTGVFCFLTYFKKDTGIKLVSYTDKFNACNTNEFEYGSMVGISVSFSDEEMNFSSSDIKALSSGKTVSKLGGMMNVNAKTRFGNIVSMEFTFDNSIDDMGSPIADFYFTMITGNALSGFFDGITSSDQAFMWSLGMVNSVQSVEGDANTKMYRLGDVIVYMDYTKARETSKISDIVLRVEGANTKYIDWSKIDTSWLPKIDTNKDETATSPSDK